MCEVGSSKDRSGEERGDRDDELSYIPNLSGSEDDLNIIVTERQVCYKQT